MILVRNIRLPLTAGEGDAFAAALHRAHIPMNEAAHCGVAKLSVDARRGAPMLVYTVAVQLAEPAREVQYLGAPDVSQQQTPAFTLVHGTRLLHTRPVVCGFGPRAATLVKSEFDPNRKVWPRD